MKTDDLYRRKIKARSSLTVCKKCSYHCIPS